MSEQKEKRTNFFKFHLVNLSIKTDKLTRSFEKQEEINRILKKEIENINLYSKSILKAINENKERRLWAFTNLQGKEKRESLKLLYELNKKIKEKAVK